MPRIRIEGPEPDPDTALQPLLTTNISADILYGYGDPAVIREADQYYLLCTSNDAPNAFPILRSDDLVQWELAGFVFPEGKRPVWAAEGARISDYWAPEMRRIGDEFLLCFSAREKDGALAIGMARSTRPEGPFRPDEQPLLRGGVIDAHIFVDRSGEVLLFWKEDSNDVWPSLLARLLHDQGDLIATLFPVTEDLRTACFAQALWPWLRTLPPIERFFLLQPLIEAVAASWAAIRRKLRSVRGAEDILDAMSTPIWAQPLSPDGARLVGEPVAVLVNDLEWEGHLIEGPWLSEQDGLYYLFYSGNDFSTPDYGIGVAVAQTPLGPFRKAPGPLLRSTSQWAGPGHPSVANGPDGRPRLFLHAFFPGRVGYKEFRALLSAPLTFEHGKVGLTSGRPMSFS